MRFFVDNCLAPRMARAFNELAKPRNEFVHIQDHPNLKHNCSDVEWISQLADEGNWIILTKDKNILKKPVERAAFQAAKLTGFFLDKTWSNLDFWSQLSRLSLIMPKIIELAQINPPGSCFKVPIKAKGIQLL
jgi:hypothetical protein